MQRWLGSWYILTKGLKIHPSCTFNKERDYEFRSTAMNGWSEMHGAQYCSNLVGSSSSQANPPVVPFLSGDESEWRMFRLSGSRMIWEVDANLRHASISSASSRHLKRMYHACPSSHFISITAHGSWAKKPPKIPEGSRARLNGPHVARGPRKDRYLRLLLLTAVEQFRCLLYSLVLCFDIWDAVPFHSRQSETNLFKTGVALLSSCVIQHRLWPDE